MDEILQSEDSVGDAVHIHDGLIKLFGNTGPMFTSNEVIKPKISKRKLQPGEGLSRIQITDALSKHWECNGI